MRESYAYTLADIASLAAVRIGVADQLAAYIFLFVFNYHYYIPAYLVGGFTLGDFLGRP